jgi:phosphate-selective porin OprO/OprP
MKKTTTPLAAKRIAIAVAAVCASFAMPSLADENKAMLDLMLKKGVITQKDYDEFIEANKDADENRRFKEQRTDQDVSKAVKFLQKNGGTVMRNGLGVQSEDGKNSMQLTGRIHLDGRFYSPIWANGQATQADPFTDRIEVRRARFGVRGQFDQDWKYEIVGNFGFGRHSGTSVNADNGMSDAVTNIDVAYFDYAANPAAQLRFGKFKMPFSLEQLTSSNNIDFMERSLTNQLEGEFVPAKESGVMLFGSPQAGLTYGIAASVGRSNKTARFDQPDLIARGTVNIPKYFKNSDSQIVHLGIGYSDGSIVSFAPTMSRTETRGTDAAFVASSVVNNPSRGRAGLEFAFADGPLKVQGESFWFKYDGSNRTDLIDTNYAQIVYNLTGESHNYSNSAGTFGWIKPNKPFSASGGGLGAWQIGLRYSSLDAAGVPVTNTGSGTLKTDRIRAITAGLTWFINDNARFMLNYVETGFSSPVGASGSRLDGERVLMMRGQLSF